MVETTTSDSLRPLMFSIAYRMLGSVTEAEDIVQEAYLRMHQGALDGVEVDSPKPYAATITTRLAIDHLRSARVRRERYVGTWLPEPLLTDSADPAHQVEVDDNISMALLVVLETLTPVERAVFLLREVFEYGYDEIAGIVGKSEPNCRQIAARARQHVRSGAARFETPAGHHEELMRRFWAAAEDGDVKALEQLLADDAVFYGDGGGKGPAIGKPLVGGLQIARFLLGLVRLAARHDLRLEQAEVNGQPGAQVFDPAGRIVTVVSIEIADGHVRAIRSIVNPDKLRHLGPVGNLSEIIGRSS